MIDFGLDTMAHRRFTVWVTRSKCLSRCINRPTKGTQAPHLGYKRTGQRYGGTSRWVLADRPKVRRHLTLGTSGPAKATEVPHLGYKQTRQRYRSTSSKVTTDPSKVQRHLTIGTNRPGKGAEPPHLGYERTRQRPEQFC